jgi:3-deoxy-7-phosphoheptulonate synthase
MHPYFLASRNYKNQNTVINVGSVDGFEVNVGGDEPVFIAGPCSIEDEESALQLALKLKHFGVKIFRAMIFKPRTSPYSFQGLDTAGIPVLKSLKSKTEADAAFGYTDIFQIGTRNMSNFNLLKHVGGLNKPVILKRGMGSTIEELLCAAEYILAQGNQDVILCERGIRTFETYTRFTLDISAVPAIKELSHLPVIIDPSHASGKSSLVAPLSRAGLAAGADGVMIEVHEHPEISKSDGSQAIKPEQLSAIIKGRRF